MYIGIDLGTSSVKLRLVSEDGESIKEVTKAYPIFNPHPLWSEQNPLQWFEKTIEGLKELTSDHKQIDAISFSGQMHGLVLLDIDDKLIRNAILWNDQRTYKEVEELERNLGIQTIFEQTSNRMLTGFTAPKVLWVKNNEPKNFQKIAKIMLPKDYLVYRFTHEFVTDVSDASGTMYYNIRKSKYSGIILDYLGIAENNLPKVLKSQEIVGNLIKEYTQLLGLQASPKIVVGGADQAISAIAANSLHHGEIHISLGTSGVVYAPSQQLPLKDFGLHSFAGVNNNYYYMGVILSAAQSLQWFKEKFGENQTYQELFDKLDVNMHTALTFLPYLNGERSPINDPLATGAFIGITFSTSKMDMLKAVLEGVGFAFKQIIDRMIALDLSFQDIKIIGGGTRNEKWIQILADIFNLNILTIKETMDASYGAAVIAMVGDKKIFEYSDVVSKSIKVKNKFIPNQKNLSYYQKKYKQYCILYPSLKEFYNLRFS